MATIITKALQEQIERHAVAAYPEECCGLLLGQRQGTRRFVRALREAQNAAPSCRKNRYVIRPEDLLMAENFVTGKGWEVLGVYHSHPDHPARPSEFDREHAILHFSYIILNVTRDGAGELSCWDLRDWDSPFDTEPLRMSG